MSSGSLSAGLYAVEGVALRFIVNYHFLPIWFILFPLVDIIFIQLINWLYNHSLCRYDVITPKPPVVLN